MYEITRVNQLLVGLRIKVSLDFKEFESRNYTWMKETQHHIPTSHSLFSRKGSGLEVKDTGPRPFDAFVIDEGVIVGLNERHFFVCYDSGRSNYVTKRYEYTEVKLPGVTPKPSQQIPDALRTEGLYSIYII